MKNLVSTYVDQVRQDRQKQLKLLAVLVALAIVVAGVVFWQLHDTGVAMTNEVFCGQEEHVHDDGCYEQVLICGNEEEDHVHNDSCYETILTCQIPEHIHTVECLMDETADVETAVVWEDTLPELSDVWSDNVVAIAESQVGYTESTANFVLADDGETHMGYTRYGAWYGNEYGDWDAMFASFCLNYAGVPEEQVPENSGAWALAIAMDEAELYVDSMSFTPAAGDLVFFDEDENGIADRVGIITEVMDDEFIVIEGNCEDAVCENIYTADDGEILAFGILPDQETDELLGNGEPGDGETIKIEEDGDVVLAGSGEPGVMPLADADNYNALVSALESGEDVTLTSDISVPVSVAHISLNSGTNVTLDLNGHTLTANDNTDTALFTVPAGATMTVTDSQAEAATKDNGTEVNAADAGRLAIMTENPSGGITLTYYVTETEITDNAEGKTKEIQYQYTVDSAGMITTTGSHALFSVTGGTLNIQSGFFYDSNSNANSRAIDQSSGTVNISGGYICGFQEAHSGHGEAYDGGAVRVTGTGSVLNISGDAVLAGNKADTGGAVDVSNGATLNISGGYITGNDETDATTDDDYGGGGIYVEAATVNMSGGYITNNLSDSTGYFDGGGGILLHTGSALNMSGGYITGNKAASGGGIRTTFQHASNVNITGGYICANLATSAEGGGICIDQSSFCRINAVEAIYINNNATTTDQHWGGGGVFCADGGIIYIQNALITENSAGGFGGGVAGCSTGRLTIAEDGGAAIYDNSAEGTHLSGTESTKSDDRDFAAMNEIFMKYGFADYYCALDSNVSGAMLGGGAANWEGSADGEYISSTSAEDQLVANYIMGLTSHPSDESVGAAQQQAQVYITGNSSSTHGGGILVNGIMVMSDEPENEELVYGDSLQLEGEKELLNASTGNSEEIDERQFTFEVTDERGAVVSNGYTEDDGSIYFDQRLSFREEGSFTYYLRETSENNGSIMTDSTYYILNVQVEETTGETDAGNGSANYTFYKITHVTVTKVQGDDETVVYDADPGSSANSAVHISLGTAFTNSEVTETSLTVEKDWGDVEEQDIPESVQVTLYRNDEQYEAAELENPATLSKNNEWTYTWNDLPTGGYENVDGQETWVEYTYTVEEINVSGYVPAYTVSNESTASHIWVPVEEAGETELVEGHHYLIVDDSSSYALMLDGGDITAHLTSDDRASITKHTDAYAVGSNTYSSWYADSDVTASMTWVAKSNTTPYGGVENGYSRLILVNGAYSDLSLLSQWADGDGAYAGLKRCNTDDYASAMRILNGGLQAQYEWISNYGYEWIVYDTTNQRFDSYDINNTLPADANIASLYVQINVPFTTTTTITITNTSVIDAEYTVNVNKVDGSDNDIQLSDAHFELYSVEEDNSETLLWFTGEDGSYIYAPDYDGPEQGQEPDDQYTTDLVTYDRGRLVISGLPVGKYVLRETNAPDGYQLADDWEFTLDENTPNLTLENTIEDPREEFELAIFKYTDEHDAESGSDETIPLSGAKFQLSNNDNEVLYFVEESNGVYTLADQDSEGATDILVSGTDGYIRITGIDNGDYVLTETDAPDGYRKLTEPISFVILPDGTITGDSGVVLDDGSVGVSNEAGSTLPKTGGTGAWIYMVVGTLLICGASVTLVYRKRKMVRS